MKNKDVQLLEEAYELVLDEGVKNWLKDKMGKTTARHIIKTTEQDLRTNLNNSFMDLLQNTLKNNPDHFDYEVHNFSRILKEIGSNGFASAFRDYYTKMLLDGRDFDFLEKWNYSNRSSDEELVVEIMMKDGTTQVVNHKDLSY